MQSRTPAPNGSPGRPIPQSVLKMVRSVLLSSAKGVPLHRFCQDYKRLSFQEFPWRDMGYRSPAHMLQLMPEVVRFRKSQESGGYKLYGVADRDVFNPSWFLKSENRGQPGARPVHRTTLTSEQMNHFSFSSPSSSSSSSSRPTNFHPDLTYNAQGVVTVHIAWEVRGSSCMRAPMNVLLKTKDKIHTMMLKVGEPVEIYVHNQGSAFVRFPTIETAQAVIDTFNGALVGGIRYRVRPAHEKMPQGIVKPVPKKKHRAKRKIDSRAAAAKLSHQSPKHPDEVSPDLRLRSRDLRQESCDVKLESRDQAANPQTVPPLETVAEWGSDSGSDTSSTLSQEWDDDLLSTPILPHQESESHSRFPGIPDLVWSPLLTQCGGTGGRSWYCRFGALAAGSDGTDITVTEVTSACHFWACLGKQSDGFASVASCLQFLSPASSLPSPGTLCAAFSHTTNQWKRCWYRDSSGGVAMVFYVDEGQWDEVAVGCLSPLPPFAAAVPMTVVPCVLSGLQLDSWSPASLLEGSRHLQQLIDGATTLRGRLMLHAHSSCLDPIPVVLEHPVSGSSVNAAILSTRLASLSRPSSQVSLSRPPSQVSLYRPPSQVSLYRPPSQVSLSRSLSQVSLSRSLSQITLSETDCCRQPTGGGAHSLLPQMSLQHAPDKNGLMAVFVSEVVTPDRIWLQLTSDPLNDMRRISDEIQRSCPPQHQAVQRDICSAELPSHPYHRRVLVEKITDTITDHSQANVLWIDTGKTLTVSLLSLHSLSPSLLPSSLPPLAIPCVLEGLQSTFHGKGDWFPLDVQLLWKHLLHETVYARFTKSPVAGSQLSPGKSGTVDLYFDPGGERRVVDTLVREGFHLGFSVSDSALEATGQF